MARLIICGLNAVREALQSGRYVNRIYFAKESRAKGFKELVAQAKSAKVAFDFVPQAKLNELAGTRDHQGIVAAISPVEYVDLRSLIDDLADAATLLILDRVQNPKNLGMLIRTAAAAGVAAVVLAAREGALIDDTVIRSSAGAAFRIPIATGKLTDVVRALKTSGFWIYGLDAHGTESVFDLRWPARAALVVGNETSGIRPALAKVCDALVAIPLANGIESLNASVAAGIGLFQIVRETAPKRSGDGSTRDCQDA